MATLPALPRDVSALRQMIAERERIIAEKETQLAERDRLIAQGLTEVQFGGGHGMDGDGKISFFETLDGAASYLELIEPPARRFPPHFEIRLD